MESGTRKTVKINTVHDDPERCRTASPVEDVRVIKGGHLLVLFSDRSHTCYANGQWRWFRVEEDET